MKGQTESFTLRNLSDLKSHKTKANRFSSAPPQERTHCKQQLKRINTLTITTNPHYRHSIDNEGSLKRSVHKPVVSCCVIHSLTVLFQSNMNSPGIGSDINKIIRERNIAHKKNSFVFCSFSSTDRIRVRKSVELLPLIHVLHQNKNGLNMESTLNIGVNVECVIKAHLQLVVCLKRLCFPHFGTAVGSVAKS